MSRPTLKQLLEEGRLEAIPADAQGGFSFLEEAHRHLVSAEAIAELDPNGAYSLLYDSARKAVTAHMLMSGYRATKHKIGSHAAVVDYAEAVLGAAGYAGQIRGFDRMRRTRNRSEYGIVIVGAQQLEKDLEKAKTIVAAVTASWPSESTYPLSGA